MLGVGEWPVHPSAKKAMIQLLKLKLPTVISTGSLPEKHPNTFIVVERMGGDEQANGMVSNPMFAFQCYALDAGSAEDLAELVLSVLKNAQFTRQGPVQYRKFELVSNVQEFPNSAVPGHRRYQFTGTFSLSSVNT